MRHFLYAALSTYPDPIDNDENPILAIRHYTNTPSADECYVVLLPELVGIEVGDRLWFSTGHRLIGAAAVKRIEHNAFNKKAIWFDKVDPKDGFTDLTTGLIPEEVACIWNAMV